jgi:hypothetical protein
MPEPPPVTSATSPRNDLGQVTSIRKDSKREIEKNPAKRSVISGINKPILTKFTIFFLFKVAACGECTHYFPVRESFLSCSPLLFCCENVLSRLGRKSRSEEKTAAGLAKG